LSESYRAENAEAENESRESTNCAEVHNE
jgi:hypothetical protein